MNKLSNLLDAGHIALDVQAHDESHLLRELSNLLVRHDHLSETCGRRLEAALLDRERMGCTRIGEGVAVPHGYVVDLPSPIMLFARLRSPVLYGEANDQQPVDLVFLLAGPREAEPGHAQTVARIARLLHDRAWLSEMRRAESPEAVIAVLRDVERRHG